MRILLCWYHHLGCIGDVSQIVQLEGEGVLRQQESPKSAVQPHAVVEVEEKPQEVFNYSPYTPNGDNRH
jgi:hypothetical protein